MSGRGFEDWSFGVMKDQHRDAEEFHSSSTVRGKAPRAGRLAHGMKQPLQPPPLWLF